MPAVPLASTMPNAPIALLRYWSATIGSNCGRRTYNLFITPCIVQKAVAALTPHTCLCPTPGTVLTLAAAVPAVSSHCCLAWSQLKLTCVVFVELDSVTIRRTHLRPRNQLQIGSCRQIRQSCTFELCQFCKSSRAFWVVAICAPPSMAAIAVAVCETPCT